MSIQLTLAARYLMGRKLRTVLTTLAVVFGVFVIFGMNILLPTLLDAFTNNIRAASKQVDVTITHNTGEAFALTQLRKVRAIAGVSTAAGSLNRTVNIPSNFFARSQVSALTLIGLDPHAAQSVHDYPLKAGRFLRSDDENAALITTSLAELVALSLGDTLRLPTAEGTVKLSLVGLLPARALPGNEEVLVTLGKAQKMLDLPDRINTIEANFDTSDPARRDALQSAIQDELGKDYHLGALSSGSELITSIQTGQAAFNLFGFLALFMGGFIIFNTFRTVVAERRHDIGMLRAIGASRRTIITLFLSEGILQGVIGTAVGMALGYLMGASLIALGSGVYEQFLHLKVGSPVVDPKLIALTLTLGIGVTLVAGLLPAFGASRITPLEALRPSVADAEFSRTFRIRTIVGALLIAAAMLGLLTHNISYVALGGLALLIGLVLVAPALVTPIANAFGGLIALAFAREGTGRLAQGNITRQPSRAAVTASATMIGLAIVVAAAGVTTSITGGFLSVLQKSLGSDYLLMPPSVGIWASNVGASQALAERLRAVRGVAAVSTMRFAQASIGDSAISLLGIDPVTFPQVSALNFQSGEAATAYPQLAVDRTLIVNGPLAALTKLNMGDDVNLSTPEGVQTYRVVAVASDYLNSKIATAYTSQANLKTDFHKSDDIFIQLNLAPDADRAGVEAKLKAIVADYPQFNLTSGQAYFEENKQIFDATFATLYILLAVMALPSLIALLNTLAIGVIERTREIGMLRAIGATQSQVRSMVMAEALLLAAIGTAFGLLAGLYLGYVMVLGLSASGFPVEYSFPLAGLVAATAAGLIFGVVAALLPARQASRMDIIRALQYE